MSSRLKERGGAGGKITASKPGKSLSHNCHQDKPRSHAAAQKELPRSTSVCRPAIPRIDHGKENPRPISSVRPSIAGSSAGKDKPRPLSAGRPSVTRSDNPPLKHAVIRSASSLSRGKVTDFRSDNIPRVSGFPERRSFSGFRTLDKELAGKCQLVKSSGVNSEKYVNLMIGVTDDCKSKGGLGAKRQQSSYKASKKVGPSDSQNFVRKDYSVLYLKPADMIGGNGESRANEVVSVNANETVGNDKYDAGHSQSFMNNGALDMISKSLCETGGGVHVDNAAVHIEKNCLNLGFETVGAKGNDGLEAVKEVCNAATANGYQSNLHEKLALLESKVLKIAMEIKQTKDMLDKNKAGKPSLVLSDIQKKIFGVEEAVDDIKDGAKFESFSSSSVKFDDRVVLNPAQKTKNSLPSIKSSNLDELEARFFPHHKLMRDRLSSVISAERDSICEPTCSRINGGQNIDDGLTDENLIGLDFLASLREEQPKPKKFDVSIQFTHGMVNKMQPDNISSGQNDSRIMNRGQQQEADLESNEKLEEVGTPENYPPSMSCIGTEESNIHQLSEIGRKVSTGGWFVSGGEAVLLAHDDNSCSYYDISNSEVKSEYKSPAGFPSNLWGDCWLIRAPGIDGCSGQYVVAASAGNALESGFCSWDFYTKDVKASRVVGVKDNTFSGSSSRTEVSSIAGNSLHALESRSNWCRPCGPLLISTSSGQKVMNAYDIRDGDLVMTWEASGFVTEMEYSSPLQWRNRGKVIIAEREAITLWDVNSLNPQPTLSIPFVGKKICSLHVNNTDAEIGAGVRQRASSTEVEGNDGVVCTEDGLNVFDFRVPSGVGLKISRDGANALSIFSRGDCILLGSTKGRLSVKNGSPRSHVEHFSLRKASLVATYLMPEFNSHYHHSSITQVWGNSNIVMGICGMGLFVFDALNDHGNTHVVKETIGPDDLFRPTFDYMDSRVLVISRDRPAFWKYLL